MKHLRIRLVFFFFILFFGSKAQQNHFIYIQTENKQPFYVKLDKQLYSSAASGYIVLPKLKDGSYNLAIGFPKSEWPEQNMVCTIENKDLGFLLKNFGDKGWGLFNMQTLDIVMAGNTPKANSKVVETKTDEFSNLLSDVVNDPSIKQVDPVKPPETTPVSEGPKVIEAVTLDVAAKVNTAPVAGETPRSTISRTLFNKSSEGTELVFIDEIDGKKDTVIIFIPGDKKTEQEKTTINGNGASLNTKDVNQKSIGEDNLPSAEKPTQNESSLEQNSVKSEPLSNEKKPVDKKFIEMELPVADANTKSAMKIDEQVMDKKTDLTTEQLPKEGKNGEVPGQQSTMINSDCKNFATEEDFMKLRKKMVSEDNDDDMIALAKKTFKTKCFTVDQVKNLSVLFLKDNGKYNFFDMAYPFVSDSHNFLSLQSQLSDSYYINRFQVMIRH